MSPTHSPEQSGAGLSAGAHADLLKLPAVRHGGDHLGQLLLLALQHSVNMLGRHLLRGARVEGEERRGGGGRGREEEDTGAGGRVRKGGQENRNVSLLFIHPSIFYTRFFSCTQGLTWRIETQTCRPSPLPHQQPPLRDELWQPVRRAECQHICRRLLAAHSTWGRT